ncbi:HNH endonuclease [Aliivibrio sp. EL58]|uniref:HNH endonuclease n=1 Tax=Aliivibrio sp. EL58 TaxID=2107582 RepID=UPI000EFB8183|nr:hypothetical protein [Aliivibrio sp. EL58]
MRKISPLKSVPNNLKFLSKESRESRTNNLIKINNQTGNSKASLHFPGYNSNKTLIRNIDNGRCAYCGKLIKDTQTETVEHYRPKAELTFRKNYLIIDEIYNNEHSRSGKYILKKNSTCKFGYFLWGDYYLNLLPSCECCNTGQGYNGLYICPPNNNDDSGNIEHGLAYGKKTLFPVFLEKQTDHRENLKFINSLTGEYPLLFNPYFDDPNVLFTYKEPVPASNTCEMIVKIIPRKNLNKKEKIKAMVSINILGLNREFLCIERGAINLILSGIENSINNYIENDINNIEHWAYSAGMLAIHFNHSTKELLGYKIATFSHLILSAHDQIAERFPIKTQTLFNQNSSFEDKITELFNFYKQNQPIKKTSTKIRNTYNQY